MQTLETRRTTASDVRSTAQTSQSTSANVTARKRIAFDGGNRFIKWFDDSGNPRKIPSYIHYFKEWERLPNRIDRDSVLIETEGRRFVVGQLAKELGGRPTFEADKKKNGWFPSRPLGMSILTFGERPPNRQHFA